MRVGDVVGHDRGERLIDAGPCPSQAPLCDHRIYLLEGVYNRLRDTGCWFHCPAGHSLHFAGPSPLEREAKEAKERADWLERQEKLLRKEAQEAARRCPWPTCDGRLLASPKGLRQHMVMAHGAPWAMAEIPPDEIAQVLNGRDPAEVVR